MRVSKSEKIREWIRENPEASEQPGAAAIVAKKFKCSPSLLASAKKSMKVTPKMVTQVCGNPKRDLLKDIATLEEMGLDRVRSILDLL